MNNRSRRPLRTALMSLAAAALAAAACGASTARADSIVYVKGNAIWVSSPTANAGAARGRTAVRLAVPGRRRHDRRARRRQPPLPFLAHAASRSGSPCHVARPQRRPGLLGALSAARLARRHEGRIHRPPFAGPRPGHRHLAGRRHHELLLRRPLHAARRARPRQGLGQPRLDRQPAHDAVQTRRRLVPRRRQRRLPRARPRRPRPLPTTCTTPTPGSTTRPPRRSSSATSRRRGDKLAVGEDGFAATRTIRLYSVAARPPYKDDAPVYRCRLANPPAAATSPSAGRRTATRSPTRPAAAFTPSMSAHRERLHRLGKPRLLVAGGTSPSWGKADVVARAAR